VQLLSGPTFRFEKCKITLGKIAILHFAVIPYHTEKQCHITLSRSAVLHTIGGSAIHSENANSGHPAGSEDDTTYEYTLH
jgi:hypothetical protein